MYKIKIITGFRRDQEITINASEAHKAYYLFYNPDERACFSNGVCLIGADVRRIEPDYNATMGWNPTYELGTEDWNELRDKGVERKMQKVLSLGKEVARVADKETFTKTLSTASKELGLYQDELRSGYSDNLAEKMALTANQRTESQEEASKQERKV